MEVEIMMSSKISQTQKTKYHVFSHTWNLHLKTNTDINIKGELFVWGTSERSEGESEGNSV
jgi:hypothetical protein